MLDTRVYRAAFLPLVLAVFVAAFSLEGRPPAARSPLAADAFDGPRAGATLERLARDFPRRLPGSAEEEELGRRVAENLRINGFEVSRRVARARPAGGARDSETVIGVRPGVSSRRIVVVADRAARDTPATAELSGTAALLELATIFRAAAPSVEGGVEPSERPRAVGRTLRRTLVLVSTSGATLGGGGPAARAVAAAAGPPAGVDAVLVLGDVAGAGIRKPWVVTSSNGDTPAPLGLRRTVEAAVRREVGTPAGAPRATAQWARRAFPLTTSAQGELVAAGLPAALLQVSGERGPAAGARVTDARLGAFGRAALRTVSAVDEMRLVGSNAPSPFAGTTRGIVTFQRVLPDWAVRMLAGALLLPALIAALDAFFRVRRRRLPMGRWVGWVVAGALPFALTYLWLRLLGLVGAIDAPAAPVLPGDVPVAAGPAAAAVSALLVLGLAWFAVRRVLVPQLGTRGDVASGAAAAAIGLVLALTVTVVWVVNPYAAMVLAPAAHLWLLAGASDHLRGRLGFVAVAAGLVPVAFVVLYYALALGLGPGGMAWLAVLLAAGGHVTAGAALALSVVGGCLVATVAVAFARRRIERTGAAEAPAPRTRGPATYAGPGSLGGTESALRR